MRTLGLYLWKEWRDHRAVTLGLLIALPVLLGLAVLVLPPAIVGDPLFATVSGAGALAIALLAYAGDLVPGERRRGRLDFLRRMPAGLTAPFLAKLVVLAAALAGFAAYGYAVAGLLGGFPERPDPEVTAYLPVLAAVPWVVAVSCWLPRGALALPATGLFLALAALPLALIGLAHPGLLPTDGEVAVFGAAFVAGAFVVAWLSFARGYRHGSGIGGAAARGLLASAVLLAPAWGYAGYVAHEWGIIDAASPDFRIHDGVLAEGGRKLYLTARMHRLDRRAPPHALVVDVETGAWKSLGAGRMVLQSNPWRDAEPVTVVGIFEPSAMNAQGGHWCQYLDARTGEEIKAGWTDMRLPEVEARLRRDTRVPEGYRVMRQCGVGYMVSGERSWGYYDPERGHVFPYSDWRRHRVWIRPGRWLVRHARQGYELVDPETGDRKPAQGITAFPVAILPDGRVLTSEVAAVDPESGARSAVASADGAYPWWDGLYVFRHGDDAAIVRIDPATLAVEELCRVSELRLRSFEPIAREPGGLLGIDAGWRIARLRFGSGFEDVFPR